MLASVFARATEEPFWLTLVLLTYLKKAVDVSVNFEAARDQKKIIHSFLERTLVFYVFSFGGTFIVGLILGQGPAWLTNSYYTTLAFLIWIAVELNLLFIRSICSFSIVRCVLVAIATFTDAVGISSSGVEKALSAEHAALRTLPTAIVCGACAVTGGGITVQLFNLYGEWKFQRSVVLQTQALYLRVAIICSTVYSLIRFSQTNAKLHPVLEQVADYVSTKISELIEYDAFGVSKFSETGFTARTGVDLNSMISAVTPAIGLKFVIAMFYFIPVMSYFISSGSAFYVIPPKSVTADATEIPKVCLESRDSNLESKQKKKKA